MLGDITNQWITVSGMNIDLASEGKEENGRNIYKEVLRIGAPNDRGELKNGRKTHLDPHTKVIRALRSNFTSLLLLPILFLLFLPPNQFRFLEETLKKAPSPPSFSPLFHCFQFFPNTVFRFLHQPTQLRRQTDESPSIRNIFSQPPPFLPLCVYVCVWCGGTLHENYEPVRFDRLE